MMQILQLVLNNFSSYEGVNTFDFSVEKDKPIILIGGQNGAGKTSLFTAIKVALYGPLAFGYTGTNSYYIKKIKGFINNKAFQTQNLVSGVSIVIKTIKEREVVIYSIERTWTIVESNIEEEYNVYEGEKRLSESEKVLFESIILSIIPIDLFEFFLFDGEEIGNIFSSDNYNKFLKKSLLTVCDIDDFEILYHFCKNYFGRKNTDEARLAIHEYTAIKQHVQNIELRLEECHSSIHANEETIIELESLIDQKQAEFIRSGGIKPEEAVQLEKKAAEYDKQRESLGREVRAFFESFLPFIIMADLIPSLEKQIQYEEKATIYEYVRNMISEQFIADALKEYNDADSAAKLLYDAIIDRFRVSSGFVDNIIFGFSDSERGKILHIADSVSTCDTDTLIKKIKKKNKLTDKSIRIRQKLRNALSEEDSKRFTYEIEQARQKIENTKQVNIQLHVEIESLIEKKDALEKEMKVMKDKIRGLIQDEHILDLVNSISLIMSEIINSSLENIRVQLAEKIVDNLQQIYRKNNLISSIKISEDFKFELYQKQRLTFADIQSLIANIGFKEFCRFVGEESIEILCHYFSLNQLDNLESKISGCKNTEELDLFKKVNLNMLSKGERQIFVLSLYWAIVQVSGKQIPFVIDTPYARIDANHREEISSKFFPNISTQVIILSTDEEITREYYSITKPFISREYLLQNNQGDNRTTVTEGYFFRM